MPQINLTSNLWWTSDMKERANAISLNIFSAPHAMIRSKRNRLVVALSVFFFVWFFLFTFGVFNFDNYDYNQRLLRTLLYSFACFLTLVFNFFVVQDIFIKKYTLRTITVFSLWLTFCVGCSNFLITTLVFVRYEPSFAYFLVNQSYVLSLYVLIYPSILLVNYIYHIKKQLEAANLQSEKKEYHLNSASDSSSITILSKYKGDNLKINVSKIFYISSAGNYVEVHAANGRDLQKHMLRNTLTSIEKQKLHPSLIRCQRSYMVNIDKVKKIKKNNGSYFLLFKDIDIEIPLSKNQKDLIQDLLNGKE